MSPRTSTRPHALRWHRRAFLVLIVLALAALAGDVLSTTVALGRPGFYEANPVVADWIERYGLTGGLVLMSAHNLVLMSVLAAAGLLPSPLPKAWDVARGVQRLGATVGMVGLISVSGSAAVGNVSELRADEAHGLAAAQAQMERYETVGEAGAAGRALRLAHDPRPTEDVVAELAATHREPVCVVAVGAAGVAIWGPELDDCP